MLQHLFADCFDDKLAPRIYQTTNYIEGFLEKKMHAQNHDSNISPYGQQSIDRRVYNRTKLQFQTHKISISKKCPHQHKMVAKLKHLTSKLIAHINVKMNLIEETEAHVIVFFLRLFLLFFFGFSSSWGWRSGWCRSSSGGGEFRWIGNVFLFMFRK